MNVTLTQQTGVADETIKGEPQERIMNLLRTKGTRREIDLVRVLGITRSVAIAALRLLQDDEWIAIDGDRWHAISRRGRRANAAKNRRDKAVGERGLAELLTLPDAERLALAQLDREADEACLACWDPTGGTRIRDEDEPMSDP